MTVRFTSNDRNQAAGAECIIECVDTTTTTIATTTTAKTTTTTAITTTITATTTNATEINKPGKIMLGRQIPLLPHSSFSLTLHSLYL